MLEPRRLQGELRAPLWNPRHTGYVTPNAVHAVAARARDYAHGCRSCREKSLAPNHARIDPAIQATTPVAPGLSGRANACAAAAYIRAAPRSDASLTRALVLPHQLTSAPARPAQSRKKTTRSQVRLDRQAVEPGGRRSGERLAGEAWLDGYYDKSPVICPPSGVCAAKATRKGD